MVGTENQNERRAEDYHKFTSVCPVLILSYEMFNRTAHTLKVRVFGEEDLVLCTDCVVGGWAGKGGGSWRRGSENGLHWLEGLGKLL